MILETEDPLQQAMADKMNHLVKSRTDNEQKTLLSSTEKTQVKKINKKELKFINLDKIFWPKEKISKGDLI